jgi:hypothetical protein
MGLPQDSPSHQTNELTRSKANDGPREARDAKERIYRKEGLRDVRDGAIRKDDEEIEDDFRGDYHRGKEVDGDGEDGYERGEEGEEEEVEEPDDMGKS